MMIRWGLLSTANINQRLIPAIRMSERGELAAVASRTEETAAAYAAEWHIPKSFGSYEAMLSSDEIDAVYIGLPNHLHAPWSIKAMQMGKHVLCEKPFALTVADVDAMIAVSKETGCMLAEAFMYRHHPQTKMAGDMVRDGRLGDVQLVRSSFNFELRAQENIRLQPESGGGSLWDIGVYPVSFAQFIMGEPPKWVLGDQAIGDAGVDMSFAGQLHYGGLRMAQISSSFQMPFHTVAEVVGTKGRLLLTRPFIGLDGDERRMRFYPAQGQPEEIPVPEKELYLGEVEDMHAAILDGAACYLTLAETRNHVRTVLALYESAQKSEVVHLD